MNDSVHYTTTVKQFGNNTGIPVPEEALGALGGGKRPLVKITVNDYSYRSAVGSIDGRPIISFSSAHRKASGIQGGDEVSVTLTIDTEPRTVEVPEDLQSALEAAGLLEAFQQSAPSQRKEFVRQVVSAKKQETRDRRIAKIVGTLSDS